MNAQPEKLKPLTIRDLLRPYTKAAIGHSRGHRWQRREPAWTLAP